MIRTHKNELRSLLLMITCSMAWLAQMSISAGAQASDAGQKSRIRISNAPQKEVEFEVASIRPVRPDAPGLMALVPRPNGFVSSTFCVTF